tara:strand:- start:148 stop:552 length:405 start_codon:yes stop_codon:yes gene_type:complete
MKIRNIWKDVEEPLELHTDKRGSIVDLFYNEDINHVAMITSEPSVIRGNHYHKHTKQYALVTKGSLQYWSKEVDSNEKAKMITAKTGDLITTCPYEIHTFLSGDKGSEFIVFTRGQRGGKDYESDTFRVDNIIE